MSQEPIGVEAARQRGADKVYTIAAVETVGSGDLMVTVNRHHLLSHGELGRGYEEAVIRLTPSDAARLVDLLTFAGQVAR